MHDNISYYLQRVRMEIRQAKCAVGRDVAIVHFNLADAYLERIQASIQEIGDVDARD
jgi:hypothetical protein